MIRFSFLLLAALTFSSSVLAHGEGHVDPLLATDPEWLALLHYEPGHTDSSFVDDPSFFLSPDGSRDPGAELAATLAAFSAAAETGDRHAICRYPARLNWLAKRTGLDRSRLPRPDCAEYRQWRGRMNPHSVTLVFASAFLNSPSSMYGHTLLRIDPPGDGGDARWLSFAVNFGANIPPGEGSIAYAWRGLGGGYPGRFAVQPYYERIQTYARLENRDLWEYRLDLSPAEAGTLVDHLWELRDINFDYYFLDENCSYRLLELIDVARPGLALAAAFPAWAIPIDTVRIVEDAGLVSARDWRPAHASLLAHHVGALGEDERPLAAALAAGDRAPDAPQMTVLPVQRQKAVLLTAYRLLRYRHDREGRDAKVARRSHALLRAISRLPGEEAPPPAAPRAPENGHLSARIELGGGYRDGDPRVLLGVRPAYHDLLDNRAGYAEGSAITMGRLLLSDPAGGAARVEAAEIVSIESVSPRDAFFTPFSWQVHAGWQRIHGDGASWLAPGVDGGGGLAWQWLGGTVLVQATARLEYLPGRRRNLDIAPGAQLDWLRGWRPGTFHLRVAIEEFSGGEERFSAVALQQVELGRNWALRLGGGRQRQVGTNANFWQFSLQHYF